MKKFIILAGPSCVGKSPLYKALQKFYPELANQLQPLVLYNSRSPRPGEEDGVDYYFQSRAEVEALADRPGYVLANVRGDLQALDVANIQQILEADRYPFFEGNPYIPAKLRKMKVFQTIPTLSIFLSPLSKNEITFLKDPVQRVNLVDFLAEIMRRKLLRRTIRQKTNLSLKDLENIERRATSAIVELREAWKFDDIIPNHDGEDSEHWDAFYYPIGEARNALLTFVGLLRGVTSPLVEHWEEDVIP